MEIEVQKQHFIRLNIMILLFSFIIFYHKSYLEKSSKYCPEMPGNTVSSTGVVDKGRSKI
jgi:hypothetical protein